jgi:hypothetical protein
MIYLENNEAKKQCTGKKNDTIFNQLLLHIDGTT